MSQTQITKGYDNGVCSELLHFWTLSIVLYSKYRMSWTSV